MARDRSFLALSALLFIASAVITVRWCGSMAGGTHMPGGWTMSMAWMKMPGQSWPAAAASFLAMWTVMMIAMMLPSLVPELLRYRHTVWASANLNRQTTLAATGYFLIWILIGAAVYPFGVLAARAEMQWRSFANAVPLMTGVILLLVGCFQLTNWKQESLCRCRGEEAGTLGPPEGHSAWRYGLRLSVNCAWCCIGFMLALLVVGVMNLAVMAVIMLGITLERVAPRPRLAARVVAAAFAAAGVWEITNFIANY